MKIKNTAVWMGAMLIGGAAFITSRSEAVALPLEVSLQSAQAVTLADDDDEADSEDTKKVSKEEKKRLKEEARAKKKEEREAKRAARRSKKDEDSDS